MSVIYKGIRVFIVDITGFFRVCVECRERRDMRARQKRTDTIDVFIFYKIELSLPYSIVSFNEV